MTYPNRRDVLRVAGAAVATSCASTATGKDDGARSRLGLVTYDCALRRKWLQQREPRFDLFEPLTFLKHCHQVGASGMQASLGVLDAARVRDLREFAEQHDMFVDAIISPPRSETDTSRFEAEVRTASEVGVLAARTVIMPGRRYEQFKSLDEVRAAETAGRRMLELASPIVTKHRVRLAVENHKDQRIDERLALYKHLNCEFIGATVDTGNSFALLDDPYGAIEALAPYAFTVHFKDQALAEYPDGFLLGDIPLGQGSFDLPRMLRTLRQAQPKLRFVLEILTRDALRVPCLTERFWATLPAVPGRDLAGALQLVRQERSKPVQQVSSLPLEKQVALEDANVAASLQYARDMLGL